MASESSWGDLSTRTSALQEAAKKRASTVMAKMVLDIRRKRKQFLDIHRADDSAAKNARAAGPQRRGSEKASLLMALPAFLCCVRAV